jgi:hypothetical protein
MTFSLSGFTKKEGESWSLRISASVAVILTISLPENDAHMMNGVYCLLADL